VSSDEAAKLSSAAAPDSATTARDLGMGAQ
jgi:hypothetical protein